MKNIFSALTLFILVAIVPSCKKAHSNPGGNNPVQPPVVTYDTASRIFFTASGITDTVQMRAIDYLVVSLKRDSLWNKLIAIYPLAGGTETSAKWNLKDPRDKDEAYRLTFYGNPVFATTGVFFPTTADYADTHLTDSAIGGYYSAISYFSRTQNTISGYDMGCSDQVYPYNELSVYSDATDTSRAADNSEWFGYSSNLNTPNTTGLFMLSSTDSNVVRYRNGIASGQSGHGPDQVFTNLTIWIGATRRGRNGQKECGFASIGKGLIDTEAATFYNIVQTFETKLNR